MVRFSLVPGVLCAKRDAGADHHYREESLLLKVELRHHMSWIRMALSTLDSAEYHTCAFDSHVRHSLELGQTAFMQLRIFDFAKESC